MALALPQELQAPQATQLLLSMTGQQLELTVHSPKVPLGPPPPEQAI